MCRILIADNELSLVAELERQLLREGHQVVGSVVSGRQAIEQTEKSQPDLILMEIKLSGDMDGITAAMRIKEAHDIPIIFVTWYGDTRTLGEARWAHPAGFVLKPFQWNQLNAAIEVALSRKKSQWDHPPRPPGWYVNSISGLNRNKEGYAIRLTPTESQVANLIV